MELDFVSWLRERLPARAGVPIGVGDDAALLATAGAGLVVTTDLLIDGVHFDTSEHEPERIGRKALAVNLSDLAAMAARPVGAVVSLALPRGNDDTGQLAKRLVEGMLPLAEQFGCPIVGGDTNTGPRPLVISVTAFGAPSECDVLRRDGARPGDALLVTGELGGSLLGKHLDFIPRVAEAIRMHAAYDLHAGMDVTDGLAVDLSRLASASGVGAVIEAAAVPIAEAARRRAAESGKPPLEHALTDGEDFELLLAAPPGVAERIIAEQPVGCGITRVGTVTVEPGLWIQDADGARKPLDAKGYEHR